jgi:hypothetical protein
MELRLAQEAFVPVFWRDKPPNQAKLLKDGSCFERTNKQTKRFRKFSEILHHFVAIFFPFFVSLLFHTVFVEYIWTEITKLAEFLAWCGTVVAVPTPSRVCASSPSYEERRIFFGNETKRSAITPVHHDTPLSFPVF